MSCATTQLGGSGVLSIKSPALYPGITIKHCDTSFFFNFNIKYCLNSVIYTDMSKGLDTLSDSYILCI